MADSRAVDGRVLRLSRGDITQCRVDAIVNAANSSLMGGGGVDGAIHAAGGPEILEACKRVVHERGRLPAGDAVATPAGNLHARWVIHTVGPVWRGGSYGEAEVLARAYRSSLRVAEDLGARTVAFPSISTGAYGYPVASAARVAVAELLRFLRDEARSIVEVVMVLYDERTYRAYADALASAPGGRDGVG